MRVLVYGDSNSWGYPSNGTGIGYERRWPAVLAEVSGWDISLAALPGRTTCHDDPEMGGADPNGATWNGLKHLEATMRSQGPNDWVVIMLGTNDMKARFDPSGKRIAEGIGRLARLALKTPAGAAAWEDETPPRVGVIVPHELPPWTDDPNWENGPEWRGGRAASIGLADLVRNDLEPLGVAVFDGNEGAEGSKDDPIHFDADVHERLGRAVAAWLQAQPA